MSWIHVKGLLCVEVKALGKCVEVKVLACHLSRSKLQLVEVKALVCVKVTGLVCVEGAHSLMR